MFIGYGGIVMELEKVHSNMFDFGSITAKRWFIALIPIVFFFSPPYVQKNGYSLVDFPKWFETIGIIGANNFTIYFAKYSPVMNLVAILMVILVFVLKNNFSTIFSIYCAILFVFYGITQNTSYTEQNGLGIITSSYIVIPLLFGIWIWEAIVNKNNYERPPKINFWTLTALCMAILSFWNPLDPSTKMPDFDPLYLLTNGGNSMFCTMTPLLLAVLFFFYPNVNTAVLRLTGIIGATIGSIQLVLHLGVMVKSNWWIGILHIPVFCLSLAAVIVSFRADKLQRE